MGSASGRTRTAGFSGAVGTATPCAGALVGVPRLPGSRQLLGSWRSSAPRPFCLLLPSGVIMIAPPPRADALGIYFIDNLLRPLRAPPAARPRPCAPRLVVGRESPPVRGRGRPS